MVWAYTERDLKIIFRDSGSLLRLSAAAFIVPLIVSLLIETELFFESGITFLIAGISIFLVGSILKTAFRLGDETQFKHAFFIVTLVWLAFTFFASLPFIWTVNMSALEAYFESMSALTTTGLSLMTLPADGAGQALIEIAPKSLVFWRSFLSWIGGLGIILLAMLGVFRHYTRASRLMIAEGREKRLKANLVNTAKEIWSIYIILTLAGIVLLYFSGMAVWDSMNYSMSAISTTGMTADSAGLNVTHNFWLNEGVRNYWTEIVLVILMVLGATSFYVHSLVKKNGFRAYLKDTELKALLFFGLLGSILLISFIGAENAFFHSFSAITGGGFALVAEHTVAFWPGFAKLVLIALMFAGGSSGSTAGGIKMARLIMFFKSVWWKVKETLLPQNAMFSKKFEEMYVSSENIKEISVFILLYGFFILLGTLVLTFNGETIENSVFEVVSAQGNAGLTTGITRPGMDTASMVMLIINMFVGRLEIIPIFSLLGLPLCFIGKKENRVEE